MDLPDIPNTELLTEIGKGGMGRVFLARYHGAYGFEKQVAVKVISPEKGDRDDIRAMFLDEARLAAQLDHPSIAQVYDFGEVDRTLYLVMEYIGGMSLAELLVTQVRLPPLICASVAAHVCRGLHAAHELRDMNGQLLNVVHRDVTPQNLVLTFDGRMKILDFGIALMRERSAPVTGVGFIRGKPTYISPEQYAGAKLDRRTDLYSLSIVLHELLTGQKLFLIEDYLKQHATGETSGWQEYARSVGAPSTLVEGLPAGLDEVVMKGLSIDREERPENARALALALEEIVRREGGETLEAFVEREFSQAREEHDERLRLLQGGAPSTEVTNAPHPGTLVDIHESSFEEEPATQVAEAPLEQTDGGLGPTDMSEVTELGLLEESPPTVSASLPQAAPTQRASRTWGVLLVLALLAGGAWMVRGRSSPSKPVVQAQPTKPAEAIEAAASVEPPSIKPPTEPKPELLLTTEAKRPKAPKVAPRKPRRDRAKRRAHTRRKSVPKTPPAKPEETKITEEGIVTEW